ncbi:MAG: zinc-ribbon domain containing protein [Acidobacteriota bacterium]|nr:zinc-ribbon domain containing protein [Acidobacteriota bacterium]
MAEFQDRALKCADCGAEFTFTAGEQQFYHEKGFTNEPRRCKSCKNVRQSGSADRSGPPRRIETSAVCSQCGRETTIPFRPTQGRPVFCRDCFHGRKAVGAAAG